MSAANFGSILDKPASKVEKPKPLPAGTYTCLVKGQPRQDQSQKKKTEFVEFTLVPQQAGEDIDEDDLKTALTKADGSVASLQDKSIRATFYLTEDALWRLKKFLEEDCQIEAEEDGEEKSIRQMVAEAPGKLVMASLRHKSSEDGTTVWAELGSTAPVEE